ncbi:MAG: hypothetical protein LBS81_03725 [Endomicrobium sp.]|nr:hypothetical protein [Endomicrobium sp.]
MTVAEYYSVKSNRTDLVRGLENKDTYSQNLKRFGDILFSQDQNRLYLKAWMTI